MTRIVQIIEKTVSLASGMRNADISFDEMTASALIMVSDVIRNGRPVTGLAFDSIGRYGHGGLLRERFMPRLLAAAPETYQDQQHGGIDPFAIWSIAMRNEKAGGHGERSGAVGLLDAAAWDLQAKLEEKPLWRLLSERFPGAAEPSRVPVYASGGHYRPGNELSGLRAEMSGYLDKGYRRFKIKAGGLPIADDQRRIETILGMIGTGGALSIDFNAGLTRANAFEYLDLFSQYDLAWIEEPVDPLDFALLAELASVHAGPLAAGENLFSAADARNLFRHGGLRPALDYVNIDISLSYGIVEYLRILELMHTQGWRRAACIPHAGHLLSLQVAAGLGLGGHETAPGHDVIGGFPADFRLHDGHIELSELPGVGLERKAALAPIFDSMLAL